MNENGFTYVAYLFAHNNNDGGFGPDGDQDIIKCGTYTGNAGSQEIDLGFEPQWVMIKNADNSASNWAIWDVMRGFTRAKDTSDPDSISLYPNTNGAESGIARIYPHATGFGFVAESAGTVNSNGSNIIYMAIRRGPLAAPDDATKVFDVNTYTSTGSAGNKQTTGFPVDLTLIGARGGASWNHGVVSRLTGGDNYLATNSSAAEVASGAGNGINLDDMTGYDFDGAPFNNDTNMYNLNWKRAPSYFDVCAFSGNSTAGRTVPHGLTVAPEMIWLKRRDYTKFWYVYHKDLDASNPSHKYLVLNENDAVADSTSFWNDTEPTSSVFTVGDSSGVNSSGATYIAYLFATVAGVSKVGSYTGNGSAMTIDCGCGIV